MRTRLNLLTATAMLAPISWRVFLLKRWVGRVVGEMFQQMQGYTGSREGWEGCVGREGRCLC